MCSNPECEKMTVGPNSNKNKSTSIGVAAHIKAAAPGGKRYDPNMTSAERSDISNGIWLCQSCSKLIDTDEEKYTVELLRSWKEVAEKKSEKGITSEGKVSFDIFEIAVEDELSGELEINVDSESTVLTRKMKSGDELLKADTQAALSMQHYSQFIKNFRKYLNAMFDEVVSCELDENYMPIIDNTKISSVSSASLKVAIRLAYVLALLNESIDSKIESSHLGILLLDSPKDKDLDNYRFDKYLQTIDNECCGQIIITGSLSDEDLYKSNLKKATYFEALRTTSKLLKKM